MVHLQMRLELVDSTEEQLRHSPLSGNGCDCGHDVRADYASDYRMEVARPDPVDSPEVVAVDYYSSLSLMWLLPHYQVHSVGKSPVHRHNFREQG